MSKPKKKIKKKPTKDWAAITKRWLVEEKFFQKEIKDPTTNFHYLIEYPPSSSRFVNVFQLKTHSDGISLQHILKIHPEHKQLWIKRPAKQAKELEFELMMRLHYQRAFFQIKHEKKHGVWEQIMFLYRLFYEELTKPNLINRLDEIHRNSMIIQLVLSYRLGVSQEPAPNYYY